MDEILREFVTEAREHLERLEHDLVRLEREPGDEEALAGAFRAVHTIKGTCGFFGLARIEALAHAAEGALDRLRNRAMPLTPGVVDRLLAAVDALRGMVAAVEEHGSDAGDDDVDGLAAALEQPDPSPAPARREPRDASSTVRIDVRVLDRLMNLVGELVLLRNRVAGLAGEEPSSGIRAASQRLDRLTSRLQATVVRARLEPVGRLWGRFPRLVRDLAGECGKRVRLVLRGNETEVDRAVLEAIADPLTHLVRNSIDHGVETPVERVRAGKDEEAVIELRASQEGGQFVAEVTDDGGGVDLARVRRRAVERGLLTTAAAEALDDQDALELVFRPGFSTARRVTNLSGRGVGMDVVRTNVERLGGAVTLRSRRGRGLTTRIQLPLTLAITPGLIVRAGGERLVVPQASLRELVRVHRSEIEHVHDAPVYRLRGRLLPLVDLASVLGLEALRDPDQDVIPLAVVDAGPTRAGLIVDQVLDTREIVVKPPGRLLRRMPLFAGATILEDGRAALILDVARLADRVVTRERGDRLSWEDEDALFEAAPGEALLLCRLADGSRVGLRLDAVRRLETFAGGDLQRVEGAEVVPWNGGLLRLVPLAALLGSARAGGVVARDGRVHAVLCDGFGLTIEGVEDVVEAPAGLSGTVLVEGRATRVVTADELRGLVEALS